MRSQLSATLVSILSLLLGMVSAPFVHFHTELGVMHAHLFDMADHHDSDHDGESSPEVEAAHGHHHASDVPMIAGREQRLQTLCVDLQSSSVLAIPLQRRGIVMNHSTHGPGPPDFREFNPRSPPV